MKTLILLFTVLFASPAFAQFEYYARQLQKEAAEAKARQELMSQKQLEAGKIWKAEQIRLKQVKEFCAPFIKQVEKILPTAEERFLNHNAEARYVFFSKTTQSELSKFVNKNSVEVSEDVKKLCAPVMKEMYHAANPPLGSSNLKDEVNYMRGEIQSLRSELGR
jgi:hypothetical protein